MQNNVTLKEHVVELTKSTGILPCIKLKEKGDYIAYAEAMYEGGARIVEVMMTSYKALDGIEAISSHFGDKLIVAAGTVLDPVSAREVMLHGGRLIVNPCVIDDVIDMAGRYGVPIYNGAFTPTEVFNAMRKGATMVKIFPGALGGPKHIGNIKTVFPEVNLIPSGGITPENAAEFIKNGACAVSGARTFMDPDKIAREGLSSITNQVKMFIDIIKAAKEKL